MKLYHGIILIMLEIIQLRRRTRLHTFYDYLTSLETISDFAKNNNAGLTVMKNGEHWFHTKEEMDFLDQWIKSKLD